jgi:hypothetical protein
MSIGDGPLHSFLSIGDGPFYSFLLKAGDGVLDVPGDLQVCKL